MAPLSSSERQKAFLSRLKNGAAAVTRPAPAPTTRQGRLNDIVSRQKLVVADLKKLQSEYLTWCNRKPDEYFENNANTYLVSDVEDFLNAVDKALGALETANDVMELFDTVEVPRIRLT
jgi:hypothetical protein